MIVTVQNQEIDQPIRHEIDLDPGTDDPNHVTVHDPAPDRGHEHTQEIRMITLGMLSQNHDRNQLIRIEAQIEDHVKNVIEPDLDQDQGRAIDEDTHLMMIQNLDRKKKRKRNIKTTKEKIIKRIEKEGISVDVVTLSGMMTIGGSRSANVMMMNRKKTVSDEVLDQSQSNLMKKKMSSKGKWQN